MTKVTNPELEKLSTNDLQKLFLRESQAFLSLLKSSGDQEELQKVKDRVKVILDILDQRKKS